MSAAVYERTANPNEARMSSRSSRSAGSGGGNQGPTGEDLRSASIESILRTAQEVVGQKVEESNILDFSAEERVPQYTMKELTVGKVIGRGGFCVVYDVRRLGESLTSGSQHSSTMARQVSSSRLSSTDSADWMSGASDGGKDGDKKGGKRKDRSAKYVLKKIDMEQCDRITFLKGVVDIAMETWFLATLEHDNIIKLCGVSTDGPFMQGYFLILEKLRETLTKRIKKWMDTDRQCKGITGVFTGSKRKLEQMHTERIQASLDIAKAGRYLHERGVIFRDFKPDNIGFNAQNILKVFDFGLAREISERDRTRDGLYRMTGFTGAMRYMAPEVGLSRPYNLSADVYSWGMILWYMLALEPPFGLYTEKMINERVFRQGYRPTIFQSWSKRLGQVLTHAWHPDCRKRPSFRQIINAMKQELIELDPRLERSDSGEFGAKP